MLRTSIIFCFCFSSFGFAQNGPITITSAASPNAGLSSESLATATGSNLASQTAAAPSSPWPTALGGVTVQVQDSASVTRPAGIVFVSPGQINFQIPQGTARGSAAITINNGSAAMTTMASIQAAAPALFSLNSLGVAAATAVRIVIPTRIQSPVAVFQCVDTPGSCRLVPIDAGLDAPVYLSFYGTGIRGMSSLSNVSVVIGGVAMTPLYAGPQGQFAGLDQVNVGLPISLRGAGEVSVTVTVDGVTSNAVKVSVQ